MSEPGEIDKNGEWITPLPEDQKRALEFAHRTEATREAGFILSDGSLLASFSDDEHSKVCAKVYPDSDREGALERFIYGGAIRFRYAAGSALWNLKHLQHQSK